MSIRDLLEGKLARFDAEHPRSRELAMEARMSLLGGVPMHWMVRWPGQFPVFAVDAQSSIDRHGLPWHVTRLGCRVEYLFRPDRPRTGSEAAAGGDPHLDQLIHLWALNRGILLTPFHNMALMSPATTEADVDRHTEVFAEAMSAIAAHV